MYHINSNLIGSEGPYENLIPQCLKPAGKHTHPDDTDLWTEK